jgi:hypothetical protein
MRKKLGERFGVVFSLTMVVMDTELGPGLVFPEAVTTLYWFTVTFGMGFARSS